MIINNTYFKGEIYLPQAKPGITSNVTEVDGEILDFIYDYSESCLEYCLGLELFLDFKDNLDNKKENGLKDLADPKWDLLLNGHIYNDINGNKKRFKGIRYKSGREDCYDRSFLAYYVYFFYESNQFIQTVGIGDVKPKVKNAEVVSPSFKVTKAWRRFYKMVQGETNAPILYKSNHGCGVDYFRNKGESTLYGFINDMNKIDETNYPNFDPKDWNNINQYGI